MTKRNWKTYRANSLLDALSACKDFALERRRLSVRSIAANIGVTEDSLYKWLGTGRMPVNLLLVYELACGCHFVSDWLVASSGRMVLPIPTGRKACEQDLLQISSDFAAAVQALAGFYATPSKCNTEALLDELRKHLEQVAYHHHNVARYETPELDFTA